MKKLFLLTLLIALTINIKAQFYNGTQMTFGKNRIQYKPFNWKYYRYPRYDVYSYERGLNIGKYITLNIQPIIDEYSNFFGINLKERIIFIVYNKLSDFRQSNIGIETGNTNIDLGGNLQFQENKVFLYYKGDHRQLLFQLRKMIANLYVNQVLHGTAFKDKLTSSALLNVPKWFENGLISYVAAPYNPETFNRIKDLILHKKRINFNNLSEEQAADVGHAFWYFLADKYGKDIISNILYFSKISKNINKGIKFVTGSNLKSLTKEWKLDFEQKTNINTISLPEAEEEIKITKKKSSYRQFKVSPDKKNIAFTRNAKGKYKIIIYNTETKKAKTIYKEGHQLDQIVDNTYPVLTWNNSGKTLTFVTEKKSIAYLWLYDIEKEEEKSIVLPNISKVHDLSFAPKGGYIAISAVSNGFTDIFVYNMLTSRIQRITYDLADDINPQFDQDAENIIFASNRTSDSLKKSAIYEKNYPIANNFNLYLYNFKTKSQILTKLTNTPMEDENFPIPIKKNEYLLLSNKNGINNRFILNYDSTIAFVDTTIHYKFFTNTTQITDFSQDIIEHNLNKNKLGQIIFSNKKDRLYYSEINKNSLQKIKNPSKINYFTQKYINEKNKEIKDKKNIEEQRKNEEKAIDSLKNSYILKINSPDSSIVDINNYKFEAETDTLFKKYYYQNQDKKNEKNETELSQLWTYHPTFYTKDVSSKIDFSTINQSYQPFNGGPFYFTPGMNLFTTITVDELFNNYKLLAGIRWAINGSVEYLFSIENLKKRLDKQIIYHRQVLKNTQTYSYYIFANKIISNELIFALRYPFSQTASVRTSFIQKYDHAILRSTEYNSLTIPDTFGLFSGAKLEYIFDNSRKLNTNLYDGIKFKIFTEFYQQIHGNFYYTNILGADFRFYKNIFKNFIFATRIAGSTSIGSGKIIYYLGGVDNWINFSLKQNNESYFDKSVNFNPNEKYLFQAVATNMRGFPQNIRNGSNFLLSNTELRLPIIQTLVPYPVNSNLLYNFQIIGFFDIGSAWNGLTPYSDKNFYNKITTSSETFTVIVDIDRPPYVYGYGFGFRTKIGGYFIRLDWAWGVEGNYHHDKKIYFSLSKDF